MRKIGWFIISWLLTAWLLLTAAILWPAEAETPTPVPRAYLPLVSRSPAPTPTPLPDFEQQVIDLINQERGARSLAPLHIDDRLMRAARHHSQDMAANNFVSHTGSDGSSPWDRIRREGYPLATDGVTIAAGFPDPISVVAGWRGSSGHWSILMGDYQDIGVGYAFNTNSDFRHYWTADLAVPAQ
jgi:uncharacterized protein YkwD